jgi:prepilin-type N-terminal cleavage/methylation domain-containing protein
MRLSKNMNNQGFTLIEMAIVLSIIAFSLGAGLTLLNKYQEYNSYSLTILRANEILKAIDDYVDKYDELPCPADGSLQMSSTSFGIGSISGTTCNASNLQTGGLAGNRVLIGTVPTATLNIYPTTGIDGYGNRFSYIIMENSVSDTDWLAGTDLAIDLTNYEGSNTYEDVVVIVMSHGQNGYGAWRGRGGSARINATGGIAAEDANADATNSFYASVPTAAFDDIVYFMTENQIKDDSME